MSIALAIFVKTPGLSPIKTRLAAAIGREQAEEFYKRSLKATDAMLCSVKEKIPDLDIYWAIAEETGLKSEYWQSFKSIGQGAGNLGDRLSFVYDELISIHESVFFMGADSPHLDFLEMVDAIKAFTSNQFVLGETDDGGFYLFGGRGPISRSIWTSVEYSVATTCLQLSQGLKTLGEIKFAKKSFDIDQVEDFLKYNETNFSKNNLLPAQLELIEWSKNR